MTRVITTRGQMFRGFMPSALTDKYFTKSKQVALKTGVDPIVKYNVFIRKGPGIVCGIDEAIQILKGWTDPEITRIRALYDGESYEPCDTILSYEGRFSELVELETMVLGAISLGTGCASNMHDIVQAANGIPVWDFHARHNHYNVTAQISYAAWVGGAAGCSTDIGAVAFSEKGIGTIPHALVLVFGSTLQGAKAYHATHPNERLIVLIDTYNRECTDSVELVKTFGKALYAVRIDTHGDIVAEANEDGDKGVTVGAVRALRKALDSAGGKHVKIIVSSGFDAEKTRWFVGAGAPIDAVGTGSFIETREATADIVEVDGQPTFKTGRAYKENPNLKPVN